LAQKNSLLHRVEIDGPNASGKEFLFTVEFRPSQWAAANPGAPLPFDMLLKMVRSEVAAAAKYESSYSPEPPPRS
jgi:hypothetical protein